MLKRRWYILIAVVVVAVGVISWTRWVSMQSSPLAEATGESAPRADLPQSGGENQRTSVDAEGSPSATVPVRVHTVALRDIVLSLQAHGTLRAMRDVDIASMVSGRVKTIPVDVGDVVSHGQALFTLENDELQIRAEQAFAAVQAADANLARLQAGARPEEIEQAEAQVAQAQAHVDQASLHLERTRSLLASGASTESELEQATTQFDVASATQASARSQLEMLRSGPRSEEIRGAEAQLAQAQAGLDLARLQLSFSTVTSPLDGIVADRLIDPGNFTAAGSPVLRIVQTDPVLVRVEVGGRDIVRLRKGQAVSLSVDAFPTRTFHGQVAVVESTTDAQSRLFGVRVSVPNPKRELRPGMSGQIRITVDEVQAVLAAPDNAVLVEGDQTYLFIVGDDKAERRPVQTGLSAEGWTEITAGVGAGEHVVISGQTFLADGQRVRTVGSDSR